MRATFFPLYEVSGSPLDPPLYNNKSNPNKPNKEMVLNGLCIMSNQKNKHFSVHYCNLKHNLTKYICSVGSFEVYANDKLIFSKLQTSSFPFDKKVGSNFSYINSPIKLY